MYDLDNIHKSIQKKEYVYQVKRGTHTTGDARIVTGRS